ncbi:MAG: sigma-54-dependent Fis family transcriptional regulator [Acidobacteria bacterium]|nr:sigma-54-dependent Fis family transcriptional regulator [Acidobacteriota bacterium]
MARLLIVDDEKSLCQMLEIAFRKEGHMVETLSSGQAAVKKIASHAHDLIVCDIRMPDLTGIELLEKARESGNPAAFILITAVPTVSTAVQALNLGADRYVIKTDKLVEELKLVVARVLEEAALREENIRLRRELLRVFAQNNIVGQSRKIQTILEMVRTVAPTTSTVLITGESGTGKELIARAIHEASPRRERPFISINCGAFPETLLESELFGYFKGAFTGADTNKKGIFEAANEGTLFLDEIGDTSPTMQVKLLRVLQERKVRPLGGTVDVPVDVRLIASTNRDLKSMVGAGQFREDFYYRVSVIPIHVPPLRERREDVEPLARHFLRKFALQMGKPLRDFSPEALSAITLYAWPGNVRELENAIERAVAVSAEQDGFVRLENLPESVTGVMPTGEKVTQIPKEGLDLQSYIAQIEKQYLLEALRAADGVRTRAAELLRMSYRSFRHYAKKYGL